jgi:hypothetical protein
MREATGEVVIGCVLGNERYDGSTCLECLGVWSLGTWEKIIYTSLQSDWRLGGLEIFSILVQMPFCRSDAFGEMFINGKCVYARPCDKISLVDGLFPCGDNRTDTASIKVLN